VGKGKGIGAKPGGKRFHQILPPQALDDANKGITEELKKTNYREMLKEKTEKGESLEPQWRQPQCPSSAFYPAVLVTFPSSYQGPLSILIHSLAAIAFPGAEQGEDSACFGLDFALTQLPQESEASSLPWRSPQHRGKVDRVVSHWAPACKGYRGARPLGKWGRPRGRHQQGKQRQDDNNCILGVYCQPGLGLSTRQESSHSVLTTLRVGTVCGKRG
jgi:hypothetical protein